MEVPTGGRLVWSRSTLPRRIGPTRDGGLWVGTVNGQLDDRTLPRSDGTTSHRSRKSPPFGPNARHECSEGRGGIRWSVYLPVDLQWTLSGRTPRRLDKGEIGGKDTMGGS